MISDCPGRRTTTGTRRSELAARRKERQQAGVQGLLVVDKPVGLTSHDVVQQVRKIFGVRQVGHSGTLDPVASGVLVLMVGSATRLSQYLQKDEKEYSLVLRMGIETDTQDMTGTVLSEKDPSGVTREALAAALERYRGSFLQVPPAYSAVKKNGQPLYRLARKGLPATADPRMVTVSRLDMSSWEPPRVGLRVTCSKGTYMRTLCHDLGRDLNVGGCMDSLIRTRNGLFRIDDAVKLDELSSCRNPREHLKPAATGLPFPEVAPDEDELEDLVRGVEIAYEGAASPGLVSVVHSGLLVAVAQVRSKDGGFVLGPRRVLEPAFKELFKQ